jgi:hypothetical protein
MEDEKQSQPLAAIEFTPLDAASARRRIRFSSLYLGLGVVLAFAVLVFVYLLAARAVIFNLDPDHATISVSGLSFHIGDNFLLLPGQREVSVEADGYHGLSTTIVVTGERTQEAELASSRTFRVVGTSSNSASTVIFRYDRKWTSRVWDGPSRWKWICNRPGARCRSVLYRKKSKYSSMVSRSASLRYRPRCWKPALC